MKTLCGATNFSLALRNCEHAARYIHSGAWISFQMVGRGILKELFLKNMEPDAKKLINKAPYNLENGIKPKAGPVFLDKSWADCEFQYIRGKKTMNATDSNKYNILFIGPTGSGKSHLINCLFNSTVAQSTSSTESVTREIHFYQGEAKWYGTSDDNKRQRIINVIDTIGFCDSKMSPSEVLEALKTSVKVNASHIDKVFIVLSGRIEKGHEDAIKEIFKWLKLHKYDENVVMVYTKCENMTLIEKQKAMASVCEKFNLSFNRSWNRTIEGQKKATIPNMAVGFYPGVKFEDIIDDYKNLCFATIFGIQKANRKRIPVEKNTCTII